MKTLLLLSAGILGFQSPAHALPLLAENTGLAVRGILTAYPDSQDPNLIYFMPNSSEMAKDGSGLPQFGLTYWGLSTNQPVENAGAYLTFTLRLSSDASQAAALDTLVKQGKRLAVLPVQSSIVGLSSTKKDAPPLGRLFEEFNFSQKGGRAEDEIGVNAVLTGVGAKVFKAAIDQPQLLKADYCYKVEGLGPDFHGYVKVDMKRVYTALSTSASFGNLWIRANISAALEKLRQEGAVEVKIEGGNAKDEEYMQKITSDIVARLFQPELKMEPGAAPESGGGWSFSRFSLRVVHKEELKTETFSYTRQDLVEREFCANLAIKDLIPYKKSIIKDADAN